MARNIYPNLNDQQFRLNKINQIKDYFTVEIKVRELMSIASFDYFHKHLIVLSVTSGSISIASFATVTGASFSLTFSMSTVIVKKMLKTTRNKKKKHNKIVMLARSKSNSIETKIPEALTNN